MQDQVPTEQTTFEPTVYDWHSCVLRLPRLAKLVSRDGVRTRLLMPGPYLVRRSQTLGCLLYRRTGY